MDNGLVVRVKHSSSGRGPRRRRSAQAGGGRERGLKEWNTNVSKGLSRLLRHQAANAGIQLDNEGYAPLDRVLQWGPLQSLEPTFEDIQSVVWDDSKQRFTLKPNPATNPELDTTTAEPADWLIRANQGHSIKVDNDGLLRPIVAATSSPAGDNEDDGDDDGRVSPTPKNAVPVPPVVMHGTYFLFWAAIVSSGGLKPMGRNHVHFCTGLSPPREEGEAGTAGDAVVSGIRRDTELLIYVDVARSMRDAGIKWWMSDNGVVLTEGDENGLVPLRFFRQVVGRKPDVVGVLWSDGHKVADLPSDLKMELPRSKRGAHIGGGLRGL